ncbi:iron chelate uptake ABC transporter family permease subunit [Devosia sp. 63-57]|uniref:iron chelate uptake ABC transporter family permease subunit n=1 Tax=Devosia sp. 63-57 TaxID=1895751 RepID=UPI00086A7A45|nr:iron chelate uptake ABC transporter family permease subunit [Devosia sp. 63-57]ODT50871.1 MAG: iron ABC transporter permease [Pelagibacterium sp. SCN 63-126]ODU86744.1 MAG: iron ABC transporter permease [Pelagibacterium sp. SCN 63-17]OJX44468.1 MAG: iron ABC transporter permease [Devosia sp. 63-57]
MTRLSLPILFALLLLSAIVAVTFGPADITPSEVWSVILHHLGLLPDSPVSRLRDAIVWELRLPRVLTALGVGAGLALSGTVMQALTRNPLADPYLLGLSSGAALGAVLFLLAGFALLMPLGAFLGSIGALALALFVAGLLGGATPSRAILVGICISALASAATSFLIFWSATGDSYREILSWLMGSLSGSVWTDAGLVAAALLLCAPVILISGRALDAFAFGDNAAATLGIDVPRLRWTLLGATALLTGVMVAIGGAIGFVGLVVPHAVRLALGSRHRILLPHAMLVGAIFMLWTDTAARTLFDPRELPVGIITALIGAPAFLFVLLRYRRIT